MVDRDLPVALRALASILAHLFRLNQFPALKRKLWKRIFESKMVMRRYMEGSVDDWLAMVDDESLPFFTIDLHHSGVMTEKHMRAVREFFVTPPHHEMDEQLVRECA